MPEGRVIHRYHTTYGPSYTTTTVVGMVRYVDHYRHVDKPKAPPPDPQTTSAASPSSTAQTQASQIRDEHPSSAPHPVTSAWVIKRQRFLRSLGYGVTVDGVWGPASQAAWNAFNASKGPGAPKLNPQAEVKRLQKSRSLAEASRLKASVRKLRADTAATMARTRMLQARVGRGEHSIIPPDVRMNRDQLDAHGRIEDRRAHETTKTAAKLALLAEDQRRHNAVLWLRDRLRKNPGSLRNFTLHQIAVMVDDPDQGFNVTDPTDISTLQRWLQIHGHPEVDITGTLDAETHAALVNDFNDETRRRQLRQINAIRREFYGSGILKAGQARPWWLPGNGPVPTAAELTNILQGGGFLAAVMAQALEKQLNSPDRRFLMFKEDQLEKIAKSLYGDLGLVKGVPGLGLPSGNPLAALVFSHEQMQGVKAQSIFRALQRSKTIEDFQHNYDIAIVALEKEYRDREMERAQDKPWWGHTIDALTVPAIWTSTAAIAAVDWTEDSFASMDSYFHGRGSGNATTAQALLEERWDIAQEHRERMPWGERLALELILDPLNLVPIAKAGALVGKFGVEGALALERAGARVALHEGDNLLRVGAFNFDEANRILTKRLAASPAEFGRSLRDFKNEIAPLIRHGGSTSGELEIIHRIYKVGAKATALKGAAIKVVHENLAWAARNGFNAVDGAPEYKTPAEAKTLIYNGTEKIKSSLGTDITPETIRAIDSARGSLYVDKSRKTLSTLGGRLLGRLLSEAHAQQLQRFAMKSARSVYDAALKDTDDAVHAAQLKKAEYDRVMEAGGTFGHGGEVDAEVYKALFPVANQIEMNVMPAMQDLLEQLAEGGGRNLWDEGDLWAGRFGTEDEKLRQLVSGSFDEDEMVKIANPRHNVEISEALMHEYIVQEVRIQRARLIGNFRRREAAGEDINLKSLSEKLDDVQRTAEDHWEQIPGTGMWKDTNEFIEVSRLYARHVREAIDSAKSAKTLEDIRAVGRLGSVGEVTQDAVHVPKDPFTPTRTITEGLDEGITRIDEDLELPTSSLTQFLDEGVTDFGPGASRAYEPIEIVIDPDGKIWLGPAAKRGVAIAAEAKHDNVVVKSITYEGGSERKGLLHAKVARPAPVRSVPITGTKIDQELGALVWHTSVFHKLDDTESAFDDLLRDYRPPRDSWGVVKEYQSALEERTRGLQLAWDAARPQALATEHALWQALAHAQSVPARTIYNVARFATYSWFFATLPLRPGWVVRNVFDNTVKVMIHGSVDPRYYFKGADGILGSIFSADLRALLYIVRSFDKHFATDGAKALEASLESFLNHRIDVVNKVMRAHAMPDVPESVLEGARNKPFSRDRMPRLFEEHLPVEQGWIERWKDGIWEVMASKPENAAKRALFRSTYDKGIQKGLNPHDAYREAWDQVEKVLFDYGKGTVLEDNLRTVFPFLQFWRKNTALWVKTFVDKPWLPAGIVLAEQELKENIHKDWPEWSRRYVHTEEISDGLARIPGLGYAAKLFGDKNAMYDPLNYFSFAPLYRAWKSENISLPGEQAGWKFLAPFVDAMNDWGLSLSPFVRKPLEDLGVLNQRAWQTVFPQTPMFAAFSRRFISDRFAAGLVDFDELLGNALFLGIQKALGNDVETASDRVQQDFEYWVRTEMVNQRVRGETMDWDKAVHTVQNFILVQQIIGYFAGTYTRRMTPEDFYLYKLQEDLYNEELAYTDLTDEQKTELKLWRLRKGDRVAFEKYVEALPMIEAYYRLEDYTASEKFKREHPEVITFVDPAFNDNPIPENTVRTAMLQVDTQTSMRISNLIDEAGLPYDVAKLIRDYLVTPELEAYWAKNDTPKQKRDRMMRGLAFQRQATLQKVFFAIPEDDWEAKESFLNDHPELQRAWMADDDRADDYAGILTHLHADLRDRYFEYAEAGDWDGANAFLEQFPFIFDKINDDGYVHDRTTGRPKHGGRGRGGMSQHAKDYLAAKAALDFYFNLPEAQRAAWLASGNPLALQVKQYFDKWAHSGGRRGGLTQHAADYLAAKDSLDFYFSLSKGQRSAWLKGDSPAAAAVLAYFKKYGRTNKISNSFGAAGNILEGSRVAELAMRIQFWQKLFALPANQRPEFVHKYAAQYGIFVYGALGSKERSDREAAWLRKAIGQGLSERAAHYLYVKPLLDVFFTLNKKDKRLFLRANPELQEYLDKWADKKGTGDKKLDKQLEHYFNLPIDSEERTTYLENHPEIQQYFDKRATPAERAIHRLLEVYFKIVNPEERKSFLLKHPEINVYFDQKQAERSKERELFDAFDAEDPRLERFYDEAFWRIGERGRRMQSLQKQQKSHELTVRRARQPEEE